MALNQIITGGSGAMEDGGHLSEGGSVLKQDDKADGGSLLKNLVPVYCRIQELLSGE